MDFFTGLSQNRVLIAAVLAWLVAQVAKTIIYLLMEKEFRVERMFGGGGMPSSHSSTVCAFASSSAMIYGSGSFQFAVATVLSLIVMYDACNVRLETGKQATVINDIQEWLKNIGKPLPAQQTLKELVGHTLSQVIAGALLGIAIGVAAASV